MCGNEENIMKIKNKSIIILVVMLLLQCMYMVYWGNQKSGYYVDEFFTYDNAHYISQSTPKRQKLYDSDFMEYDKWFTVEELRSSITVQRDESLFNDSFMHGIKSLVYTRPYMALLNYVEAVFFEGKLSWWSAISLNIVFFLINQIILYNLAMKISGKPITAFLTMLIYGFCGMAVSMTVYVRFYMHTTLLLTLFTYLNFLIWKSEKIWKNIIFEVVSLLILLMAFRNSPLSAIYGAAIVAGISISILINKNWIKLGYYTLPIMLTGFLYGIIKTKYIQILLNPNKFLDSGSKDIATISLISELVKLDGIAVLDRTIQFLHIVCRFLFGHVFVVIAYLLTAIITFSLWRFRSENKHEVKVESEEGFKFIYIIAGAVGIYALASVGFNLSAIRYNSFIFPMITICIVVVIMKLSEMCNKEKIVLVVLGLAIAGEVFYTSYVPRIENLYLEDKQGVAAIKEYKGINSVVVDYNFDDRIMYECIAYTDDKSNIMFTKFNESDYCNLDDTILVWKSINQDFEIEDVFIKAGYSCVKEIGRTHESIVFYCSR